MILHCAFLTDDQVFTHHAPTPTPAPATAAAQPQAAPSRSLHPKASQSGLRPPGFSSSRLPAGRLAAFGFVRSSSVSSVSSAHSADSTQSDPCRTAHRESTCYKSVERWYLFHQLYHFIMSTLLSSPYCLHCLLLCIPLMNIVCINIPLPHSLCYSLLSLPVLRPAYNLFFTLYFNTQAPGQ